MFYSSDLSHQTDISSIYIFVAILDDIRLELIIHNQNYNTIEQKY
jgi:hypothetical protein